MARRRSSSAVQGAIEQIEKDVPSATAVKDGSAPAKVGDVPHWEQPSQGLLDDILTFRFMRIPASSFRMILLALGAWAAYEALKRPLGLPQDNPLAPLFVISHPLPRQLGEKSDFYGRGRLDVPFLAFYIIVFSCFRQSVTEYLIKPYAKWLGLKGAKAQRFVEQGYAVTYWGSSSIIGLVVMSNQPTWWYNTTEFWRGYPHWRLRPEVKVYYLLQFAYWLQQMLLLCLRVEKPRSDFVELCIHHCVTLWLIGWSYLTNLTVIGTAIFVSMDVPDTFLGISKCINYTKYQHASEVTFGIFLCIWTYFRHWLNLRILWSVFFEYEAIAPKSAQRWSPANEVYLTRWMKWQVFAPILLLQLLNLFWYYLIWRIVVRMVIVGETKDVREEDEDDDADAKKA